MIRKAMLLCAIACNEPAPPRAEPEPQVAPEARAPEPQDDTRDQYTLAREMIEAEQVPPDDQYESFARVHDAWEGRRYRWTMMRVDGLCRSEAQCLFAPFDLARFDHPVDFAFLPSVRFSGREHARMRDACEAHAPECVVTFEATLSDLVLEPGSATRFTLTDARFLEARRRADAEHFLSRPERSPSSGPRVQRALGGP